NIVKGDDIAGYVIIIFNIICGLTVGMVQQGVPAGEALNKYALLTVGDGLVAQVPALLISTATGIVVTRAAGTSNLGAQMFDQLSGQARPLLISGAALAAFGMLPGLPKLPFIVVAGLVAGSGFVIKRTQEAEALAAAEVPIELPG